MIVQHDLNTLHLSGCVVGGHRKISPMNDTGMTARSIACYARNLRYIPGGSSTGSKAPCYPPEEPSVIVRGKGCRVWDADGNEYIDFRNSLGPITLGYAFPEVDDAIKAQLADGIAFGHSHPIEGELAELICEMVPCAEQVRFLKTGGEAMAATMRLARFITGRDHIVQIGYQGWLNSCGAGARLLPNLRAVGVPPGVPKALSDLHHELPWNNPNALEEMFSKLPGQIAAVCVSADYADMGSAKTFYPLLRTITEREGALLIFDEIVTGFRMANGGIQEYVGVTPDLAGFAKGLANGMPLSCYCGKREYMQALTKVKVSSTLGGEVLSLVAARAVLKFYRDNPVTEHIWEMGRRMWNGLEAIFQRHRMPIFLPGLPPVKFFVCNDDAPEGLVDQFLRCAYANGVSLYNGGYVNWSHKKADIDEALSALERAAKQCTDRVSDAAAR